jgi:ribonuclease HI
MDSKKVVIFTDGSAINNTKNAPGGSAVLIVNRSLLLACSKFGTNNERELDAIRYALRMIFVNYKQFNCSSIVLYSDSEYSIKAITGEYKAKANLELIKKARLYIEELKKLSVEVTFVHVRAHTRNDDDPSFFNSIVDKTANDLAMKLKTDGTPKIWHSVPLSETMKNRIENTRIFS